MSGSKGEVMVALQGRSSVAGNELESGTLCEQVAPMCRGGQAAAGKTGGCLANSGRARWAAGGDDGSCSGIGVVIGDRREDVMMKGLGCNLVNKS